jgi:hypothetical protein
MTRSDDIGFLLFRAVSGGRAAQGVEGEDGLGDARRPLSGREMHMVLAFQRRDEIRLGIADRHGREPQRQHRQVVERIARHEAALVGHVQMGQKPQQRGPLADPLGQDVEIPIVGHQRIETHVGHDIEGGVASNCSASMS